MLGRPMRASRTQGRGVRDGGRRPIPVGRKLQVSRSCARVERPPGDTGWQPLWLSPACRVIYDDDTWLVVDSFRPATRSIIGMRWKSCTRPTESTSLIGRMGWRGIARALGRDARVVDG